jgi:hypothetical protein
MFIYFRLNIVLLNYFLFILNIYMFFFLHSYCDYKMGEFIEFGYNLLSGIIMAFYKKN